MKILLTGGTGFIGSELLKLLTTHQIVLLTRSPDQAKQRLQYADLGNIEYLASLDELADLNNIDAVINLAGEPIADKRWTEQQKEKICDSRLALQIGVRRTAWQWQSIHALDSYPRYGSCHYVPA